MSRGTIKCLFLLDIRISLLVFFCKHKPLPKVKNCGLLVDSYFTFFYSKNDSSKKALYFNAFFDFCVFLIHTLYSIYSCGVIHKFFMFYLPVKNLIISAGKITVFPFSRDASASVSRYRKIMGSAFIISPASLSFAAA